MKTLYNYVQESTVNEGIFKSTISLINLSKMDPEELLNGMLNMYDYIVDGDDINLFYQDMRASDQILWKNLYELYQKKLWSILDVPGIMPSDNNDDDNDSNINDDVSDAIQECFSTSRELIKVTPQFRRHLRFFIKQSRNNNLDLSPGLPEYIMIIPDEVKKCSYIFTINKTTGIFNRLFNVDKKCLMKAFSKLGE